MKEFILPKSFILKVKVYLLIAFVAFVLGGKWVFTQPILGIILYVLGWPCLVTMFIAHFYLKDKKYVVSEEGFSYKFFNHPFTKDKFKEGYFKWDEIKAVFFTSAYGGQITIILKEQSVNPIFYFSTYGLGDDIMREVYKCAKDKTEIEIDPKLNKKLKLQ